MTKPSKKEKRRQERRETRQERLKEAARKAKARKRNKALSYAASAVVVAAVAFGLYVWLGRDLPGESYPNQGNRHVPPGAAELFPYNTDPPTSGPHYGALAPWGVHRTPIAKGLQVHNLEDGGVVVHYRCQDCPDLVERLGRIVSRYPTRVILAPYPGMEPLIALTAWTRMDRLDRFDEARIVRFIEAYRGIDHHVRGF